MSHLKMSELLFLYKNTIIAIICLLISFICLSHILIKSGVRKESRFITRLWFINMMLLVSGICTVSYKMYHTYDISSETTNFKYVSVIVRTEKDNILHYTEYLDKNIKFNQSEYKNIYHTIKIDKIKFSTEINKGNKNYSYGINKYIKYNTRVYQSDDFLYDYDKDGKKDTIRVILIKD